LISSAIAPMKAPRLSWKKIVSAAEGLSQAEIVRAADDAVKIAILDQRTQLKDDDVLLRLHERHAMRSAFLTEGK
jgi:ATP-dependent 26S proteasome regulatory subunit